MSPHHAHTHTHTHTHRTDCCSYKSGIALINEPASGTAGSSFDGASKRRRKRHRDEYQSGRPPNGLYRRSRSVPPNGTLPARDRGATFTVAAAAVGDNGVDGVPKRTTSIPPEVRLTATVRPTRDGGLEVLVMWNWVAFRDSALARKKASGSETFEFTVHWARKTCNVDDRLPHCDDPDAYYSNTAWSNGPKVRVRSNATDSTSNGRPVGHSA